MSILNNTSNKSFLKLQYKILGAKQVKVGSIESELSTTDTAVYWYMHNQYFDFLEDGKNFFTSQEQIGEILNMSVSSVKRAISRLEDFGLLAKQTNKVGKIKTVNTYAMLHYTLALWDGKNLEGDTPECAYYDPLVLIMQDTDESTDSYSELITSPEAQQELRQISEIGSYSMNCIAPKHVHWTEIDEKIVIY